LCGGAAAARARCLFLALSTPAVGASVLWRRGAAKFGAPAAAAAAWVWAWAALRRGVAHGVARRRRSARDVQLFCAYTAAAGAKFSRHTDRQYRQRSQEVVFRRRCALAGSYDHKVCPIKRVASVFTNR
jgi:hypothetical protein